MQILVFIIMSGMIHLSWTHGDELHTEKQDTKDKQSISAKQSQAYMLINQNYLASIKDIFIKSCFDCHSTKTQYPWYYKIPGIGKLIDSDIKEAKKHLDFSDDFPFISHETPKKDLEAIAKAVKNNSMPPLRYKFMHWNAILSKEEKKQVLKWTEESIKSLK